MNITPGLIYWITRLDAINIAFLVLAIAFGLASIIAAVTTAATQSEINEGDQKIHTNSKRVLKYLLPTTLLFVVLTALTPTTKEMATIMILPKIANSNAIEQVQDDAGELYGLTVDKLKEMLGETVENTSTNIVK